MAMDLETSEICPGTVGTLIDDVPLLTHAMVRPYVVAIVLHRGAVRLSELCAALTPHCAIAELQVGAWSALEADWLDCTRLELVCSEVLGEFVAANHLRYNGEADMWVAHEAALPFWVSKAAELNSQLPLHLLRSVDITKLKAPF